MIADQTQDNKNSHSNRSVTLRVDRNSSITQLEALNCNGGEGK